MISVMLVDDEILSRNVLSDILSGLLPIQIIQCSNGLEAIEKFKEKPVPLIFTDIKMPQMNGIDLLTEIKKLPEGQFTKIVLFTGFAELDSAVQAIHNGAFDYLFKPVDVNRLVEIITDEINKEKSSLPKPTDNSIKSNTTSEYHNPLNNGAYFSFSSGIDNTTIKYGIFSTAMRHITQLALKFHEDRSIPVLIEGETGTGKELVARLIHNGNSKVSKPYISINCSAISPNLFESELFGYVGGAFTGAKNEGAKGKFELAQEGTIFLDEIGEIPMDLQAKLLKVIEDRKFYRVGGNQEIKFNARIIAATNKKLSEQVKKGLFRQDLFHRLNTGWINIPPLRDQPEAIPMLAQMFLNEFAEKRNKQFRYINDNAVEMLSNHTFPGNIRELRNIIDRITLLYDEIELQPKHLRVLTDIPFFLDSNTLPVLYPKNFTLPDDRFDLKEFETEIVKMALKKFNGNKSKTAKYLGLTLSSLRSRL